MSKAFIDDINSSYNFEGSSFVLGGAMIDKSCQHHTLVKVPLSTLNRHGLIAGATGTGKTKTLQIVAEQLARNGVPSLVMDIKGDLSGIAQSSDGHPKIDERHAAIGIPFEANGSTVEFLSLSEEPGVRLRSTISEFGPVLFSKILGLNETQLGVTAVVFKYCDDHKLPLIDLKDFQKTLHYVTNEGKEEFTREYGRISTASVGAIIRKMIALEQQGADQFFGEPSFDVEDLVRVDEKGQGVISILRLTDLQAKPQLFSTFMMSLLAEVYATFPEEGDLEQPKLILFIDEAHLLFDKASDELLDQIETIIKLIRSKGVGIYFITQNPTDIPEEVLGQLGMKIQHALRAFTAKDRKAIKMAAQNFPESNYYQVDELLTELGIGEALVTVLNEDGIPTQLVHTLLRAPESRMDVLTEQEIDHIIQHSKLIPKYNQQIDRESAHEMLLEKIEKANSEAHQKAINTQRTKARKNSRYQKSTWEEIADHTITKQIGRTVARELTRGLLGVLGVSSRKKRR